MTADNGSLFAAEKVEALIEAVRAAAGKSSVVCQMEPVVPWNPETGPPPEIVISTSALIARMPSEAWSDVVLAVVELEASRGE